MLNSFSLQRYSSDIRALALLLTLFIICIFFNIATEGIFLSAKNITNLTRQSSIVGLLAVGMVLVIVSGHIDLSVGSLTGLLGGLSAIFAVWWGWSLPVSIIATLLVGALAGCLQGWVSAYLRVPSFIVTLGGLMIFRGAIKGATRGETITVNPSYQFFGSGFLTETQGWLMAALAVAAILFFYWRKYAEGKNYIEIQEPFWMPASKALLFIAVVIALLLVFHSNDVKFPTSPDENDKSIPVPVMIWIGVALVIHFVAMRTVFGRRIFAIGGNTNAAFYSGIHIRWHTMMVFVITGVLSAVAGIIYTARVGSAAADAGRNLELDAIAACVIGGTSLMGGRGSVPGALLGALIMASIDNGMSIMNIEDFYQNIIKGTVLVLAVYLDVASKKN